MSPAIALSLALILAYGAGSIPFGLLVARANGVDLRRVGSGNIGATNVGRALGRKFALLVFGLDMLKGCLPTALLPGALLAQVEPACASLAAWLPVAIGFSTVVGHCFPVWLKFRGGKGVATTVGVLLALDPLAFLAAGGVWIATLLIWRMVSLSSLALGAAFPIFVWLRHGALVTTSAWPLFLTSIVVFALIALRHRSNLARIFAGTEPKVFAARRAASEQS